MQPPKWRRSLYKHVFMYIPKIRPHTDSEPALDNRRGLAEENNKNKNSSYSHNNILDCRQCLFGMWVDHYWNYWTCDSSPHITCLWRTETCH